MSASSSSRALLACACISLLFSAVMCSPSLGGWGLISWTLHPVLLTLATWLTLPSVALAFQAPLPFSLGLPVHSLHAALGAASLALALAGYAMVYYLHMLDGKTGLHLPPLTKAPSKILHIYCGLAVLLALCLQAASGLARRAGCASASAAQWHSSAGLAVWLSLAAMTLSGLYLPLVEKPGGFPGLFALLCAAAAGAVALLLSARSSSSGSPGDCQKRLPL